MAVRAIALQRLSLDMAASPRECVSLVNLCVPVCGSVCVYVCVCVCVCASDLCRQLIQMTLEALTCICTGSDRVACDPNLNHWVQMNSFDTQTWPALLLRFVF